MATTDMPASRCPRCGAGLPLGAGGAVCPRCALADALGSSPDDPGAQVLFLGDIPQPGQKVAYVGDHELLDVVARGGMGVVYRARQRSLNRIVALKMLLGGIHAGDDFKRRFRHEAEMAAQLQHPNIVPIFEVGEHEGQPYFAMEYVAGDTLADRAREHPLPAAAAASYVKTVAEAVHFAHQQGILHRDLKPSNILLGADDRPRVTDFGLARQVDADSSLTLSGQALGTPGYLPPEQASGKRGEVGPRSDVYALGAVLYHLLTGRPPFFAGSVADTLQQVLEAEPVSPRKLNPAVPQDLETICLKCLEKEPARRYETALALADELGRFLKNEPILARPVSNFERLGKWCRREPIVASLTAAVLVVVVAGFLGVFWQWRKAESERNQTQEAQALIDIQRAENVFEAGDSALALARLGAVLRHHPSHRLAAQRVVAALHQLNYAVPLRPSDVRKVASVSSEPGAEEKQQSGTRLSPDGRLELVLGTNAALILDATSRKPVAPALKHEDSVNDMGFSPDGAWVATASADGTARLWDTRSGQLAAPPLRHAEAVLQVRFTRGGRELVTVTATGTTQAWALVLGQWKRPPLKSESRVAFMEFDPSSRYLFVCDTKHSFAVWDANCFVPLTPPLPHTALVQRAGLSDDAKYLATLADDDSLRIWKTDNGEPMISPISNALASPTPGGWHVTGTNYIVQISGDRRRTQVRDLRKPRGSGALMLEIRQDWDPSMGKRFRYKQPQLESIYLSPNEKYVLGIADNGAFALWLLPDGTPVYDSNRDAAGLRQVSGTPTCVDFSPASTQVAIATDRDVTVLNTLTGWRLPNPLFQQQLDRSSIVNSGDFFLGLRWGAGAAFVKFWRSGRFLLAVSPAGDLTIWDIDGRQVKSFGLISGSRINFAVVSADESKLVICAQNHTALVWDLNAAKPMSPPLLHSRGVVRAWFSPDASCVLTLTADEDLQMWDCATGKPRTEPIRMAGKINSPAAMVDDVRILKTSGNSVQVWNSQTGELLSAFMRHAGPVGFASFSPGSARIVTCSADTTARLWDAESGYPLSAALQHNAEVLSAKFSTDGERLATSSADNTVRIWDMPTIGTFVPNWLPDIAEGVAGQRLTKEKTIEPVPGSKFCGTLSRLSASDPTWGTAWTAILATNTAPHLLPPIIR